MYLIRLKYILSVFLLLSNASYLKIPENRQKEIKTRMFSVVLISYVAKTYVIGPAIPPTRMLWELVNLGATDVPYYEQQVLLPLLQIQEVRDAFCSHVLFWGICAD